MIGAPGRHWAWVLACTILAGCTAAGSGRPLRSPEETVVAAALDEADGPALLLLMADQLLFEPFAVRAIFRHHPELHEQLAITLGRVGDPRGLPYLDGLLEDPVVEVRRAAAFALGQLRDRRAYPNLLGALGDPDREVGRLAVQALARIGLSWQQVEPALGVLPEKEKWQRLLPELFRFSADEIHGVEAAVATMFEPDGENPALLPPDIGRWLLYALARGGDARGVPRLRRALEDTDPWVQGWAARALGRLGDASDLDRLRPLLASPDAGVVVHALGAARRLVDEGKAAAPRTWLADLERLAAHPHPWIRLAAVDSAGSWSHGPTGGAWLRELAARGQGRIAELALVSLARADDIETEQFILAAAASQRSAMREAAARAAALAGFDRVVEALLRDPVAAVRIAALGAVLEGREQAYTGFSVQTTVREALLDPDLGMRIVALDWLSEHPIAPLDELVMAAVAPGAQRMPELLISGASALGARAATEPRERGASVAALERLAENPDYTVRRAAGEALVALGREQPALGTVASPRTLRDYRAMAEAIRSRRRFEISTERALFTVELDTRRAPLTSLSFIQLAHAGFFDGLDFHRVIPDFVAQGGDPRGDGWGGPGYSLRDENHRLRFERGVIGMARSGTHTAGSQFFLTMSSQPHLNGSYTAFGKVIKGAERLHLIEQGDVIASIREVFPTGNDPIATVDFRNELR